MPTFWALRISAVLGALVIVNATRCPPRPTAGQRRRGCRVVFSVAVAAAAAAMSVAAAVVRFNVSLQRFFKK